MKAKHLLHHWFMQTLFSQILIAAITVGAYDAYTGFASSGLQAYPAVPYIGFAVFMGFIGLTVALVFYDNHKQNRATVKDKRLQVEEPKLKRTLTLPPIARTPQLPAAQQKGNAKQQAKQAGQAGRRV